MEVISNGEHSLAGRGGRHSKRLKALVPLTPRRPSGSAKKSKFLYPTRHTGRRENRQVVQVHQ
jgi:hypothetical protein